MSGYKNIPICAGQENGSRYRAVEVKIQDTVGYDLVPKKTEPGPLAKNIPPEKVEKVLEEYAMHFNEHKVCKLPDKKNKGEHVLFLTFKNKLSQGGSTKPYPSKIPQCKSSGLFLRAVKYPTYEDEPFVSFARDATSYLAPLWEDPSVGSEEMKEYIRYRKWIKAEGICQKKISNERYGLFWQFKADRYKRERPINSKIVIDKAKGEEYVLSEDLKRCAADAVSAEENAHYAFLARSAHVYRRGIEKEREDLAVRQFVADELEPEITNMLPEKQVSKKEIMLLREILAFGLENGLSVEEILSDASMLSEKSLSNEELIYALWTTISLRVAQRLHDKNLANGGISKDFHLFAETTIAAVLDMRIKSRERSPKDYMKISSFAFYDTRKNEIVYPYYDPDTTFASMFEAIIHECYHAYEDMTKQNPTLLETERRAYRRGRKAMILLNRELYEDKGNEARLSYIDNLTILAGEYDNYLTEKRFRCHGHPKWRYDFEKRLNREDAEANSKWHEAIVDEALGRSKTVPDVDYFYKAARVREYVSITDRFAKSNFLSIGQYYERGEIDEEKIDPNEMVKDLERRLAAFKSIPKDKKDARSRKALSLLNYGYGLMAHAFYLKEKGKNALHKIMWLVHGNYESFSQAILDYRIPN